jgi:hypothetical protein
MNNIAFAKTDARALPQAIGAVALRMAGVAGAQTQVPVGPGYQYARLPPRIRAACSDRAPRCRPGRAGPGYHR